MPDGAVYVGRPSKWGNPFHPINLGGKWWGVIDDNDVAYAYQGDRRGAAAESVRLFEWDLTDLDRLTYAGLQISELRGHDLSCWCPLDQPCHADVLLELANA
jgi:hypothetical protein